MVPLLLRAAVVCCCWLMPIEFEIEEEFFPSILSAFKREKGKQILLHGSFFENRVVPAPQSFCFVSEFQKPISRPERCWPHAGPLVSYGQNWHVQRNVSSSVRKTTGWFCNKNLSFHGSF